MKPEQNPLFPNYKVPFASINAGEVRPAVDQLLATAREKLDRLVKSTGPQSFNATMLSFEDITEEVQYAFSVVNHLEKVATTPELREALNAIQGPVTEFCSSLTLSPELWRVISSYAASEEARGLAPTERRFVDETARIFRLQGAELPQAQKDRLMAINIELSQLCQKFSENVLDATNAFELMIEDETQLAGLPESARAQAKADAARRGKSGYRFSLQAPSLIAVLTYLDSAAIREQVYRANSTRARDGALSNTPLINSILKLRQEKARLLGFKNFAEYSTHDRMAGSATRALDFVRDLRTRTKPAFQRENDELQRFRRELEGPAAAEIRPWDVAYYAEKQRRALYDLDEEALRPYFPFDRVLAGLFDLARQLFGITVREVSGFPVWAPEVRTFSISDEHGRELGIFYIDFFPRDAKRGGAWMDEIITAPSRLTGAKHVGMIMGNFTPPLDDRPALLLHNEVQTFFHEFGHLLHHMLSTVSVRSLAGTRVAWDFVELPSQIMENWCWERGALDMFARHFASGTPIPDDLYQKVIRARNFRSANQTMRQLGFAYADLLLHTDFDPEGDVLAFSRSIINEFSPARLDDDYAMINSFTHLFSDPVGYAGGYYSYKWAEVLDADAFTRFEQEGIFDPAVGREFRDQILARGNSQPAMDLFRGFMGREPNVDALLKRCGLLGSEQLEPK